MKSYSVTVNGNVYDVEVEEKDSGTVPVMSAPIQAKAPTQATKSVPAATPAQKSTEKGRIGSIVINSPMPGKILTVKVNVGQEVKKGEVILLLEAMKMENEIVALENGKVSSINVATGDMVEAGDVLASLN